MSVLVLQDKKDCTEWVGQADKIQEVYLTHTAHPNLRFYMSLIFPSAMSFDLSFLNFDLFLRECHSILLKNQLPAVLHAVWASCCVATVPLRRMTALCALLYHFAEIMHVEQIMADYG